jgi:hypothetical protein
MLDKLFSILGNDIAPDSELAVLLNDILDAIIWNHLLPNGVKAVLGDWKMPNIVGDPDTTDAIIGLINMTTVLMDVATTGGDDMTKDEIKDFADNLRELTLPDALAELAEAMIDELFGEDFVPNDFDIATIFQTEAGLIEIVLLLNNGYEDEITPTLIFEALDESQLLTLLLEDEMDGIIEVSPELYTQLEQYPNMAPFLTIFSARTPG